MGGAAKAFGGGGALIMSLSLEDARTAISEIMDAFREEQNEQRMLDAKDQAKGDTMQFMQLVFPVALSIQASVISKYGFTADQHGIIEFTSALRNHAQDAEVFKQVEDLKKT